MYTKFFVPPDALWNATAIILGGMWTRTSCMHFTFLLDMWVPAPFLCTTLLLAINYVPCISMVLMWHLLKCLWTYVSWFGCPKPCHALCLCQLRWRFTHKDMYECGAVENGVLSETVRISLTRDEKSVWVYLFVSFSFTNTLVQGNLYPVCVCVHRNTRKHDTSLLVV